MGACGNFLMKVIVIGHLLRMRIREKLLEILRERYEIVLFFCLCF